MALKSCKECGKDVSSSAKSCPHCGKKLRMGALSKIILWVFVIFIVLTIMSQFENQSKISRSSYAEILRNELSYLIDIEEVSWYEVNNNNVYIGFSPVPNDWNLIIRGAAFRGNKAIDFGVHVWALEGSQRGWRPGDGSYLGEVTARYGRVQD